MNCLTLFLLVNVLTICNCHLVNFDLEHDDQSIQESQNSIKIQNTENPLSSLFEKLVKALNSTVDSTTPSSLSKESYDFEDSSSVSDRNDADSSNLNIFSHFSSGPKKDVFDEIVRLIFSLPSRKLQFLQPFAAGLTNSAGQATKKAARITSKAAHTVPTYKAIKADVLKTLIRSVGDTSGSLLTILSHLLNTAADAKLSSSHGLPNILSILANVKGQVGNTLADGVIGAKQIVVPVVQAKGKLVQQLIHGTHGLKNSIKIPEKVNNNHWASSSSLDKLVPNLVPPSVGGKIPNGNVAETYPSNDAGHSTEFGLQSDYFESSEHYH